jgi:hypothetical protein
VTTAPLNPLAGPPGPGMYSTRTDNLQMGSIAYGEGKETQEILSAEPLAKTADVRPSQAPSVGLFDDSQNKSEPITAGIDTGAGPGSNALMMQKNAVKLSDSLALLLPYDTTGEIAVLYQEALAQGN